MNTLEAFKVGNKFKSFSLLTKSIKSYERATGLKLSSRNNEYLPWNHTKERVSNVPSVIERLVYYRYNVYCEFGAEETSSSIVRRSSSKKLGCPFFITFLAKNSYLEVTQMHSHFEHVSTTFRRPEIAENVMNEITVCKYTRAPIAHIVNHVKSKHDIDINPKDIHNKLAKITQNSSASLYFENATSRGDLTEIRDEGKESVAYLFQDAHMRNVWSNYSDILMMDSTYGLLEKKWSYFVIIAINGEGQTEPVAWFVVKDETVRHLRMVFNKLSERNNFGLTESFCTDKDMSERAIIKQYFKNATLRLCLFHVNTAVKRMFSFRQLGLTVKESKEEFEKFLKFCKCNNLQDLDIALNKFSDKTKIYIEKNWYNIRGEFIDGFKPKNRHLGVRTTGRCESFFSHMKRFCLKRTTIENLVMDSCNNIKRMISGNKRKIKNQYLKRERGEIITEIHECKRYLTKYGFEYLNLIYELSKEICDVELRENGDCSICIEEFQIGLPCMHQLAKSRNTTFILSKCAARWTKRNIVECYCLSELYLSSTYTFNDKQDTKKDIKENQSPKVSLINKEKIAVSELRNTDLIELVNDTHYIPINHGGFTLMNDTLNDYTPKDDICSSIPEESYTIKEKGKRYTTSWGTVNELSKKLNGLIIDKEELKHGIGEEIIRKIIDKLENGESKKLFDLLNI